MVLKEVSFDPLVDDCKQDNSVAYLMNLATKKQGLELVGLRMAYLTEDQKREHYSLFHEHIRNSDNEERPVFALAFRGIEAQRKIDQILGHNNPD